MSIVSLMVTADHAVPVEPQGGTATVTVLSGGPVYYADNQQVSSASNQGQIALNGSQSFASPAWIVSSSVSSVQVSQSGPSLVDVVLGSDGRVGGPGGTALTASVVNDSQGVNAPLKDGAGSQLVNIPAWQTATLYPSGYVVQNGGVAYTATATFTSGASFGADGANWASLSSAELGYAQITSQFSTASVSYVDVTGLSITVVSGGRPFYVKFNSSIQNTLAGGSTNVQLVRTTDSVIVGYDLTGGGTANEVSKSVVEIRQGLAAGTYSYKVQIASSSVSNTSKLLSITGAQLPFLNAMQA